MNTIQNVKQFETIDAKRPVAMDANNETAMDWEVVVALNQSLAHAIDLRSRIKQAYWSAKGGNFYMLHKKFNDFSSDLDSVADELAARVLARGGVPVRTISIVARTSKLPPYPLGAIKALEHLDAVIASYEAASTHLPAVMRKVVQTGDRTTASVITGFSKLLDEQVGFITSHIPAAWVAGPKKQSVS
jgi:starvation-inducible DNA-binding protein